MGRGETELCSPDRGSCGSAEQWDWLTDHMQWQTCCPGAPSCQPGQSSVSGCAMRCAQPWQPRLRGSQVEGTALDEKARKASTEQPQLRARRLPA